MFTFEELRKKYPTFVYRSYTVSDDGGNLKVTYEFALGDDIVFRPSWVFPYQKEKIESGKNAKVLKRVLFLLGCVELVSYRMRKVDGRRNALVQKTVFQRARRVLLQERNIDRRKDFYDHRKPWRSV